jgi:hypothetical protein
MQGADADAAGCERGIAMNAQPSRRKTCTHCNVEKGLQWFYPHKSGKYSRSSKCKVCTRKIVYANRELKADLYRERARARYANNPELKAKRAAYYRDYIKTERGRTSRRITQRVYRAFRKAAGLPPLPSDRPEAIAERNRRGTARRQAARHQMQASA